VEVSTAEVKPSGLARSVVVLALGAGLLASGGAAYAAGAADAASAGAAYAAVVGAPAPPAVLPGAVVSQVTITITPTVMVSQAPNGEMVPWTTIYPTPEQEAEQPAAPSSGGSTLTWLFVGVLVLLTAGAGVWAWTGRTAPRSDPTIASPDGAELLDGPEPMSDDPADAAPPGPEQQADELGDLPHRRIRD